MGKRLNWFVAGVFCVATVLLAQGYWQRQDGGGVAFAQTPSATATPFRPAAATVNLASSSVTATTALAVNNGAVRIYNSGSVTAFIKFCTSTPCTAAVTDLPVPGGVVEVLSTNSTNVAAITASGTATIYFTPGNGL